MSVVTTSRCTRFDHPEFQISYDSALVPVAEDVAWLVRWLEDTVERGARYLPGQTIQVGWSLVQVREVNDGFLSLWEPDWATMPINWVESVSHALSHLRVQKDVVESFIPAVEMAFPSLQESAIICSRLGDEGELVLDRFEPKGHSSGWFFGCADVDHNHNDAAQLQVLSLYEVSVRRTSRVIPYLALPPGTLIELCAGCPHVFQGDRPLAFAPGSYLARRFPKA